MCEQQRLVDAVRAMGQQLKRATRFRTETTFSRGHCHQNSSPSLPPSHIIITLCKRRLCLVQRVGHPLIWRRNWPPPTRLGDLLQEPAPLRFPDDHFPIDATYDYVLDDGVVVVAPIARVPAFD